MCLDGQAERNAFCKTQKPPATVVNNPRQEAGINTKQVYCNSDTTNIDSNGTRSCCLLEYVYMYVSCKT